MEEEYLHKDLTHRIIGCAMQVHRTMGAGFPEMVYQRCLAIELAQNGLAFQQEVHLPLHYRGQSVGSRRVDLLVENTVLLELKAVSEHSPLHEAQIINYLNAYKLEVGLLLNFGQSSLLYQRYVSTQRR